MKFIKRLLKWILIILIVLTVAYFLGPRPSSPTYTNTLPSVPADAAALETYIKQNEAQHKIKPENEARIVWANDSTKQKTEYAIVYLHGFSASQEEGDPVHTGIAKKFGCNLYLARLAEHGIDTTEELMNLTAEKYWETVKQAYAIGKELGNKVIIMGTSTGGTNALQLAANYPEIFPLFYCRPILPLKTLMHGWQIIHGVCRLQESLKGRTIIPQKISGNFIKNTGTHITAWRQL